MRYVSGSEAQLDNTADLRKSTPLIGEERRANTFWRAPTVASALILAMFGAGQAVDAGQTGASVTPTAAAAVAPRAAEPSSAARPSQVAQPPQAAQPAQAAKPAQTAQSAQPTAPAAALMPVGTMSDLMVKIIYPASDAVFYITTRIPQDGAGWAELEGKTLMLAESGNLMMMPAHQRDEGRWMADAKLMRDAGAAAYKAAKAKDVKALDDLNDALYQSCVTCHQHYRRNYGRGR